VQVKLVTNKDKGGYCSSWLWYSNKYALSTKREVKVAGNWPSSFCTKKNETTMVCSNLDRANFGNKGFIIWPKEHKKKLE